MLKLKVNQRELQKAASEIRKDWEKDVAERLIDLFDRAIEYQWIQFRPDGYNDDTGQLRSSTGYVLFHNGKIIHEKFELSHYGTDKAPGLKEGRDYAFAQLRRSIGFGAWFVAGMDYAGYVQAKGFSVLMSAEMEINKNFLKELDDIVL